jgi:TraM recognition site of TraD and TraG
VSTEKMYSAAAAVGRGVGRLLRESGSNGAPERITGAGLHIGVKTKGEVRIPFSLAVGNRYVIVGSSDSGKTVVLIGLVQAAVRAGAAVIFVDPKGDPGVCKALEGVAEIMNRRLIRWTPEGPTVYNAYRRGTPTEIADKLLCGEVAGTHPHYLKQARWFLAHEIRILQARRIELSLSSIVNYMDAERIQGELGEIERTAENRVRWNEVAIDLKSITSEEARGLMGTRRRLAGLAQGDFGRWLACQCPEEGSLDLLEAARGGDIVYFRLDADKRPLESATLGGAIVHDINSMVGHLQDDVRQGHTPRPVMIAVDEFGALDADVTRVFSRGRSANVSMVIASQTFHTDMNQFEGQRERLVNSMTALVALRQADAVSALEAAEVAGKEEYMKVTRNDKGGISETLDERFRVAPDQIQGLKRGEAMVSMPGRSEEERAVMVRLNSPQRLEEMR